MSEPRKNHSFENTYFTEDQVIERLEKAKVKKIDEKEKEAHLQRIEDHNNVEQMTIPGMPAPLNPTKEQPENQEFDEEDLPRELENPNQQKLPLR